MECDTASCVMLEVRGRCSRFQLLLALATFAWNSRQFRGISLLYVGGGDRVAGPEVLSGNRLGRERLIADSIRRGYNPVLRLGRSRTARTDTLPV